MLTVIVSKYLYHHFHPKGPSAAAAAAAAAAVSAASASQTDDAVANVNKPKAGDTDVSIIELVSSQDLSSSQDLGSGAVDCGGRVRKRRNEERLQGVVAASMALSSSSSSSSSSCSASSPSCLLSTSSSTPSLPCRRVRKRARSSIAPKPHVGDLHTPIRIDVSNGQDYRDGLAHSSPLKVLDPSVGKGGSKTLV